MRALVVVALTAGVALSCLGLAYVIRKGGSVDVYIVDRYFNVTPFPLRIALVLQFAGLAVATSWESHLLARILRH